MVVEYKQTLPRCIFNDFEVKCLLGSHLVVKNVTGIRSF